MVRWIRQILEMIRFSHTIFALPFALLAAVMAWTARDADGHRINFSWLDLFGIVMCMVTARSAAMAFNRLSDRRLDAKNPRTKQRHLPAGKLSFQGVLWFTVGCSVAFIGSTLLFLPNRLPIILSVPVLCFLLAYSWTKRFTALAHFWLGAALMLSPISTWIAIRGEQIMVQPWDLVPAAFLGGAVLLWVAGFDIIYACQDVEFDKRARLCSVPVRWGVVGALRLAAICHLGMISVLATLPFTPALAGLQLSLGPIYWCAVVSVAGLLIYEHSLVRPDDLHRMNVAFFNVNAIVSLGLFVVGAVDLLT